MEKIGYIIFIALYLLIVFFSIQSIETFYPDGLMLLLVYGGILVFLIKTIKDRLSNKEDDYYSKEINE